MRVKNGPGGNGASVLVAVTTKSKLVDLRVTVNESKIEAQLSAGRRDDGMSGRGKDERLEWKKSELSSAATVRSTKDVRLLCTYFELRCGRGEGGKGNGKGASKE